MFLDLFDVNKCEKKFETNLGIMNSEQQIKITVGINSNRARTESQVDQQSLHVYTAATDIRKIIIFSVFILFLGMCLGV